MSLKEKAVCDVDEDCSVRRRSYPSGLCLHPKRRYQEEVLAALSRLPISIPLCILKHTDPTSKGLRIAKMKLAYVSLAAVGFIVSIHTSLAYVDDLLPPP